MLKIYIQVYILLFIIFVFMEKQENKNNRTKIKNTGLTMRTSEAFLDKLVKLAAKKQMTKTGLIEYLVLREADKELIK